MLKIINKGNWYYILNKSKIIGRYLNKKEANKVANTLIFKYILWHI